MDKLITKLKKKKKKSNKDSRSNKNETNKKKKSKKRPSVVSTPIHNRNPVRSPSVKMVASYRHRVMGVPGATLLYDQVDKPLLRPEERHIVCHPKVVQRSGSSVRKRPVSRKGSSIHRRKSSRSIRSHRRKSSGNPLGKLDSFGLESRCRNQQDIDEWVDWRIKVNEQLASYVLRDEPNMDDNIPVGAIPKTLSNDSLNAILYQGLHVEKPTTSLDKLSYMIYGLPRAKLDPSVAYDQELSPPIYRKKGLRRTDLDTLGEARQRHTSAAQSHSPMTQRSSEFDDTDTGCSYIDRSSSPALPSPGVSNYTLSHTYNHTENHLRIPERHYEESSSLSTSPNAFHSYDYRDYRDNTSRSITPISGPLGRLHRPPVPGAVPTVLSGLSIHQIPKLRPTHHPRPVVQEQPMPSFARPQAPVPHPMNLGYKKHVKDPLISEMSQVRLNPTPTKQNPIFEDNCSPELHRHVLKHHSPQSYASSSTDSNNSTRPVLQHQLKHVTRNKSSFTPNRTLDRSQRKLLSVEDNASKVILERARSLKPVSSNEKHEKYTTNQMVIEMNHGLRPVQSPARSETASPSSGIFEKPALRSVVPSPPKPPPPPPLPPVVNVGARLKSNSPPIKHSPNTKSGGPPPSRYM